MPLRDKLKKAFHREHDEESPKSSRYSYTSQSTPGSPVQSTRYGDTTSGEIPRVGQRPLSNTGEELSAASGRSQELSRGNPAGTVGAADQQAAVSHKGRRSEDVMANGRASGNVSSTRYSEDVADSNIAPGGRREFESDIPAQFEVKKNSSDWPLKSSIDNDTQQKAALNHGVPDNTYVHSSGSATNAGRPRGDSISRKAVTSPSRTAAAGNGYDVGRKNGTLDPEARSGIETQTPTSTALPVRDLASSKHVKQYAVKDGKEAPSLAGVVDLTNTVDTTVDEQWAPAVVHEIVDRDVHHIREEVVTREIHYHDVYHRILPIIDIEVLPARHFVPDSKGGLIEISEDEIPGQVGPYRQPWVIMENVSKGEIVRGPRRFTAREFKSDEGDYKEYISGMGVPTTETTWVHPPTIATYGQENGKTLPFHFGSPDPSHDGLRFVTASRPIIGSSRKHHKNNRSLRSTEDDLAEMSLNEPASQAAPKGASRSAGKGALRSPHAATTSGLADGSEDPRLATA